MESAMKISTVTLAMALLAGPAAMAGGAPDENVAPATKREVRWIVGPLGPIHEFCKKVKELKESPEGDPFMTEGWRALERIPGVKFPVWHRATAEEAVALMPTIHEILAKTRKDPGEIAELSIRIGAIKERGFRVYVSDPFQFDGMDGLERIALYLPPGDEQDLYVYRKYYVLNQDNSASERWGYPGGGFVITYHDTVVIAYGGGSKGGVVFRDTQSYGVLPDRMTKPWQGNSNVMCALQNIEIGADQ